MSQQKQPHRWSRLSKSEKSFIEDRLRLSKLEKTSPITPRPSGKTIPLSSAQERLWFLHQLEPESPTYNRPWALRLKGELDFQALERSLNEIMRRHESLRTTFPEMDGQPCQMIQRFSKVDLILTDLRVIPNAEREQRALQLAREEARHPFDLAKDPMLRPFLIQMDERDHILLLTTHHISFDGWSETVLFNELALLYSAYTSGQPSPLADLRIQYPDFAYWETQKRQEAETDSLVAFWKDELNGAPPLLRLQTDRARPRKLSHQGASQRIQVSDELAQSIKEFSQSQGTTLFMTLLSVFNIALYNQSGETDIILGTPVAGRKHSELEGMIGFFVNTLVLRNDLNNDPIFHKLLAGVRQRALRAFEYQDFPFGKLVEVINPPRKVNYSPIVQVTFSLRNYPITDATFPNLEIEEFKFDSGISRFDFGLEAEETTKGLFFSVFYNQDLFEKETVTHFLKQYQDLLNLVISNPDQELSRLINRPIKHHSARDASIQGQTNQTVINQSNLTGMQLLTWTGQKLRPDDLIYNLPYTARIFTTLDPKHFQVALQELINSSDVLRTVFIEENGLPRRVVLPTLEYQMPLVDLSANDRTDEALNNWIEVRSQKQLKLTEQLFDFALIKLSDSEWVWYLAIHHIIGDNWSVQLIFQRLQLFYEASLDNQLGEVPSFPQFETYCEQEQSYRESQLFKNSDTYWKRKFSRPVVPLSFYGTRFQRTDNRSERVSFELDLDCTKKLRALSTRKDFFTKSEEASLLNALTTTLFAFLYRISGIDDLVIATTFHNRHTSDAKQTIGLFMEPLALRIKIDEAETFSSLNKKVTKETIESLQYRRYPLRNPIHSPIYELVLNFHNVTFPDFLGEPVEFRAIHTNYDEDLFGIHVRDYDETGSLKITFAVNRTVFPLELRKRIIVDFERTIRAFLSNPDSQLDDIELLSEQEKEKVIFEFNQTKHPFLEDITISQLFEEQVLISPHQIAVISENKELTYAQLNEASNKVAHHLIAIGVQPEDLIGLHVERSIDMIIGLLGILKAGGAYLPLDPHLPRERLALILKNAKIKIILSQKHLDHNFTNRGAQILYLDDGTLLKGQRSTNPEVPTRSHHLAYVIYTSGSTGVPKGVMIEHRSLVNFVLWARDDWELTPKDRVLQFIALSWDAHIEEIFPTLTSGATLVLRSDSMIDTFQGFLTECQELDITLLDMASAYWHELTNAIIRDGLDFPPSVRLVLTGGEKLQKQHVQNWLSKVGREVRIVNDYGLTECTSIATQFDLREKIPPDATDVPIGKPIRNVQTYILDKWKKPVAIGLPGELWIGGESLARGYLNDPSLTEAHFLPNHLDQTPGDRLLRTGDLARHLSNGNLEILGRIDQQVKIRGYRIELSEIEYNLSNHSSIQAAVVGLFDAESDDQTNRVSSKHLVAHYVLSDASFSPPTSAELRDYLEDTLPEYMIPTFFIELDAFPLNPNGKVDRDALPLPDLSDLVREKAYQPPQSKFEKQLAAIWEEVLDYRPIGIMDDFFELGGHSLLAVRLFSMIEKELRITLPLAAFFESSTIVSQARSIEDQSSEEGPMVVAVQDEGNKPPFFCVSPTIIDVMTYMELSKEMGPDQPFYAMYSQQLGQWRRGAEHRKSIAVQFIEKIQEVDPDGPYFIGGYSAGGVIALEIAQQMKKLGLDVKLLVLFDTFGPDPPQRLPWVTPWMFNALLVVRRIESYFWKFWLLDWKAKLDYLRISRIQSWAQDRYREVNLPYIPVKSDTEDPLSLKRGEYLPGSYDGDVLLIRAQKGMLGVKHDPKLGWEEVFTGNFETCFVPGDHEAILFGPRSRYVAMQLNAFLSSANN